MQFAPACEQPAGHHAPGPERCTRFVGDDQPVARRRIAQRAQLKTPDGRAVATATFDFTGGYVTVTVKTVAGGILAPGFHGLHIHEIGKCEPNSVAPDRRSARQLLVRGRSLPGARTYRKAGKRRPDLARGAPGRLRVTW